MHLVDFLFLGWYFLSCCFQKKVHNLGLNALKQIGLQREEKSSNISLKKFQNKNLPQPSDSDCIYDAFLPHQREMLREVVSECLVGPGFEVLKKTVSIIKLSI